jgi:hypothetical protein
VSAGQPMGAVRRRGIPGMAIQTGSPEIEPPAGEPELELAPAPAPGRPRRQVAKAGPGSRRAADYSATRLVNFRLPVDLHDRFRALVREAEARHPRLRKASLTELLIALLEEGPTTADEVAELIRRKRLAEHEKA